MLKFLSILLLGSAICNAEVLQTLKVVSLGGTNSGLMYVDTYGNVYRLAGGTNISGGGSTTVYASNIVGVISVANLPIALIQSPLVTDITANNHSITSVSNISVVYISAGTFSTAGGKVTDDGGDGLLLKDLDGNNLFQLPYLGVGPNESFQDFKVDGTIVSTNWISHSNQIVVFKSNGSITGYSNLSIDAVTTNLQVHGIKFPDGTTQTTASSGGSTTYLTTNVSGNYTVGANVTMVFQNTGLTTVTLPDPTTYHGPPIAIKNISGSGDGTQVISSVGNVEGGASASIGDFESGVFQTDGTDWWGIAAFQGVF